MTKTELLNLNPGDEVVLDTGSHVLELKVLGWNSQFVQTDLGEFNKRVFLSSMVQPIEKKEVTDGE